MSRNSTVPLTLHAAPSEPARRLPSFTERIWIINRRKH